MKRLLTITMALAFALGTVYPAFAADEKAEEKSSAKKKKGKKSKKGGEDLKEGSGTSTPVLYAISGSVTGVQAGHNLTLSLTGAASRSISITQSGAWTISDLPAGSYTVSLSSSAYTVTPASRQAVIQASSVTGIGFQVSLKPPPAKKTGKYI
jgi:hypothetical protein